MFTLLLLVYLRSFNLLETYRYEFLQSGKSWKNARTHCQQIFKRDFANFSSRDEQDSALDGKQGLYWIDLEKDSTGEWVWGDLTDNT